jgi:tetratricopeptide (TPR) repeat protein
MMKLWRYIGSFHLALLTVAVAPPAEAARDKKQKSVERVVLARVLLRDGLPERALSVLEAPPEEGETIDLGEFHRVRGLAAMELRRYPEAVSAFERAMENGEQTAPTFFGLANALLGAERYPEALAILKEAPSELEQNPARYRLEANIQYRAGHRHRAFDALDRGVSRFPDDRELTRQRLGLLLELGLYTEGIESARALLVGKSAEQDYLALSVALLNAGQHERALALLEDGVLRWPGAVQMRKQLARAYADAGSPRSAAAVLMPLAGSDGDLPLMTAELRRRAGQMREALRANAEVLDQAAKMRQRLSLLLELERFEEASLLETRLERLGLLREEPIIYALAYASHYAGRPEQAERLLTRLSEPEWFDKGTAIRRAIETCRRDPTLCD